MAADFLGLTTSDAIRSQLGSGEKEFDDTYIESLGLDSELNLDLLGWFPEFSALISDTSAEPLVTQQKLAIQTYSKAFCALKAIPTVRLRFLQKESVGDNQGHRFQNKDSIKDLQEDLREKVAEYKLLVLSITTAHSPVAAVEEYKVLGIGISTPGTDVITG